MRPLCFVLMPFGRKPVSSGFVVDFDVVYADLIAPGIEAAGLQPLRADQELTGGIIHRPMFERLILCEFAVARRMAAGKPDYWDHATRLELAVLGLDQAGAEAALGDALANVREKWEPETTARNLHLIRRARERRGEPVPWALALEQALMGRAM